MTITQSQLDAFFKEVDFPEEFPGNCEFINITPDKYNTGDSPEDYKCKCRHARECPVVVEKIEEYYETDEE